MSCVYQKGASTQPPWRVLSGEKTCRCQAPDDGPLDGKPYPAYSYVFVLQSTQSVEKLFQKAHQQERIKFHLFLMEYERLREETATDTNEGGINYQ